MSEASVIKSVCVYCASQPGADLSIMAEAEQIGAMLARAGLGLVYGGGNTGLMGAVADGAKDQGGHVLGVIPEFLFDRERGKQDISELRVVADMHERKMAMFDAADAFIILPGGLGTLEELFEVLTWRQLGQHDKPILIHSPKGYYKSLNDLIESMLSSGYLHSWREDLLAWSETLDDMTKCIDAWASR